MESDDIDALRDDRLQDIRVTGMPGTGSRHTSGVPLAILGVIVREESGLPFAKVIPIESRWKNNLIIQSDCLLNL